MLFYDEFWKTKQERENCSSNEHLSIIDGSVFNSVDVLAWKYTRRSERQTHSPGNRFFATRFREFISEIDTILAQKQTYNLTRHDKTFLLWKILSLCLERDLSILFSWSQQLKSTLSTRRVPNEYRFKKSSVCAWSRYSFFFLCLWQWRDDWIEIS